MELQLEIWDADGPLPPPVLFIVLKEYSSGDSSGEGAARVLCGWVLLRLRAGKGFSTVWGDMQNALSQPVSTGPCAGG